MALLRDIWGEVLVRVQHDEEYNRFWNQMETDIKTEAVNENYIRLTVSEIGPSEVGAVSGNPPFMALEMTLKFLVLVFHDDPDLIFDQFLKGMETIYNAIFKKDVVFSNKIQTIPTLTF